jgi:hypothetical protein
MIAMRKKSPLAAGRFYVIIPGRSTAPAFLSRGLLTRAGLRLAPAQVLPHRLDEPPAPLLGRLVLPPLLRLLLGHRPALACRPSLA